MANFNRAYEITREYEGGYVNDPVDVGGETYKGVARNYYPSWRGWAIIDERKNDSDFPACLEDLSGLQQLVRNFFKANYWDLIWGDRLPDQSIANEMFDIAVNMGVHRAVKFLQIGLNLLNRNEQNYADIVEDGQFGPNTFQALQTYLSISPGGYLRKILVILRGAHYLKYMQKSPTQERFARGWLNRVNF